jgi:hypothetical protein
MMSEIRCIVCDHKTTAKLAQVQVKAVFDCDECNGTGESYLSDDCHGSCDCLHDCGPWVKCNVCDYCGHTEKDLTSKSLLTTIGDPDSYLEKAVSIIQDERTNLKAANDY